MCRRRALSQRKDRGLIVKELTSIDEYLEKTAQGKLFGGLGSILGAVGKAIKAHPWVVPAAVTGALVGPALDSLTEKTQGTLSYRVNRGLHSLIDRIHADETVGEAFAKEVGKQTGHEVMGLAKDIMGKGLEVLRDTFSTSPARQAIFEALKQEDSVLANADDTTIMEAYHTMARFAPTLSTDKNAVKSFLREAVMSGGGVNYNTIKLLTDAENSLMKQRSGGGYGHD